MRREYTYGRGEVDGMFYIFYRESPGDTWQQFMVEVAGEWTRSRFAEEIHAQHFVRDMNTFEKARKSHDQE